MSGSLSPLPRNQISEWLQSVVDRTSNPTEGDIANLSETYPIPNVEFKELVMKIQQAIAGKIAFNIPRQEAERMLKLRGELRATSPFPMTSTPLPAGRSPGPACGSPPSSLGNPLANGKSPETGRRLSFSAAEEVASFTSIASPLRGQHASAEEGSTLLTVRLGLNEALAGNQHLSSRSSTPTGSVSERKSDAVIDLAEQFKDSLSLEDDGTGPDKLLGEIVEGANEQSSGSDSE